MAKFRCVCGYILQTSGDIPNPNERLMISDREFGDVWDEVDKTDKKLDSTGFLDLYGKMKHVFVCPQSGHIWIYWDGFGELPTCYQPLPPPT